MSTKYPENKLILRTLQIVVSIAVIIIGINIWFSCNPPQFPVLPEISDTMTQGQQNVAWAKFKLDVQSWCAHTHKRLKGETLSHELTACEEDFAKYLPISQSEVCKLYKDHEPIHLTIPEYDKLYRNPRDHRCKKYKFWGHVVYIEPGIGEIQKTLVVAIEGPFPTAIAFENYTGAGLKPNDIVTVTGIATGWHSTFNTVRGSEEYPLMEIVELTR